MKNIVLDTNCLLIALPKNSPYHNIWMAYCKGEYTLCVTNEILLEYMEIIALKSSLQMADRVISFIINSKHTKFINLYYKFGMITQDPDDNKFVDCCIAANASYIVTNDHHFDVLKKFEFPKVETITIQEFRLFWNQ
jgi:putative PIN family toxin of toxin-antitoxin system